MNQKDNLLGVLETLFKWSKSIMWVCGIALIGSIVISLFLTTYYQATTVFFAASPDVAKPEQIFGTSTKDMDYYGNENDIDRILTISESNELLEFLIQKFNLYEHYDIDSTHVKAPDKVKKALLKLYEVEKTKRDAINVSVEDEDPELAANMANTAREKIDEIARRMIKASQQKLINTIDNNLKTKEEQLNVIGDSLMTARQRYNIYNTDSQSEALAQLTISTRSKLTATRARLASLEKNKSVRRDTIAYIQAAVIGLEQQAADLELNLKQFNSGMAKVDVLNRQHVEASVQMSEDQERFKQIQAAYNSEVSAVILVEKAQVPVVKSRPMRSLIVIGAVMIAFLFSVIGVLLLDSYKDVDWKKIVNAK
ncbi:MAG: hypothetical protein AB8G22_05805 [Saprospiraceae bacterium]